MNIPVSFMTNEGIDAAKLCVILKHRSILKKYWEELGKIIFIFHDRYGLTLPTILKVMQETLENEK